MLRGARAPNLLTLWLENVKSVGPSSPTDPGAALPCAAAQLHLPAVPLTKGLVLQLRLVPSLPFSLDFLLCSCSFSLSAGELCGQLTGYVV